MSIIVNDKRKSSSSSLDALFQQYTAIIIIIIIIIIIMITMMLICENNNNKSRSLTWAYYLHQLRNQKIILDFSDEIQIRCFSLFFKCIFFTIIHYYVESFFSIFIFSITSFRWLLDSMRELTNYLIMVIIINSKVHQHFNIIDTINDC